MTKKIKILVVGDSISVGIYGNGLRGPLKIPGKPNLTKGGYPKSYQNNPASIGGWYVGPIKKKFEKQIISLESSLPKKPEEGERRILIISVATNDATTYSMCHVKPCNRWGLSKNPENAIRDVKEIIKLGEKYGFEVAVMNLIKYNGKRTNKTFLTKNEQFRKEFNNAISQYSFDSKVSMGHRDIHPDRQGYKQLLKNALAKFNLSVEKDASSFLFPSPDNKSFIGPRGALNIPAVPTPRPVPHHRGAPLARPPIKTKRVSTPLKTKIKISPKFKITNNKAGNCKENIACRCVTRSTPATVSAIQTALQRIAGKKGHADPLPLHGADGKCGPETRSAIMAFQKDLSLTLCDGCVGPETYPALNRAMGIDVKSLGTKLRSRSRTKLLSGSGYTIEKLEEKAKLFNVHPDVLIIASMLASEPDAVRDNENSRLAIFNTVINRIGSNSDGKWSRRATSNSEAWKVIVGWSSTLGGQGTEGRNYATNNFPSSKPALSRAIKEVISFSKQRLRGSNIGDSTNFFHQGAQAIFWKKTVARLKEDINLSEEEIYKIKEKIVVLPKSSQARTQARIKWRALVGPSSKTYKRMVKEVGRFWKGSNTKTSHWPKGLARKWRGFDYGPAPEMIATSWTNKFGPEVTIDGQDPRSTLRVFGNKHEVDESMVQAYLQKLIKPANNLNI